MEDDELRITTQQRRIQRAQRRARQYVKRGTSLVDELLAERRAAARGRHDVGATKATLPMRAPIR